MYLFFLLFLDVFLSCNVLLHFSTDIKIKGLELFLREA